MRETQADVVTTGKLLEWNEVEEVAAELFTIWGGGDLRWAKVAWTVLSETGLTRYASEVDRTVCIVRLIALNALYREFCVYAFDEGTSGDWEYQVTADLLDDDPFVDAFSLGQFQWIMILRAGYLFVLALVALSIAARRFRRILVP